MENLKNPVCIDVFTDGSCISHTGQTGKGPAGFGVYVDYKKSTEIIMGNSKENFVNRMELTAVVKGLEFVNKVVKDIDDKGKWNYDLVVVRIFSDSIYIGKGGVHIDEYKELGWTRGNKQKLGNVDLWKKLYELKKPYQVNFYYVKSHQFTNEESAIREGNVKADALAKGAAYLANKGIMIPY